jgi:hypothetical protein
LARFIDLHYAIVRHLCVSKTKPPSEYNRLTASLGVVPNVLGKLSGAKIDIASMQRRNLTHKLDVSAAG